MSKKKRFGVSQALSRGLSETISVVENDAGIYRNILLPLSRIELDPENPRKLAISLTDIQQGLNKEDPLYSRKFEELSSLTTLANTIQSSGLINPIVVYKRGEVYRVVAGERRCLASILAGKSEIDARVFNEKPQGFSLKLIQWIENTAREDLTLDERINNIRDILHEYQKQQGHVTVTATVLKNITGLSLPQATYYSAVLDAPNDVTQMIANGKIRSLDKAAVIASITSTELRHELLQACIHGCSLKKLRQMIAHGKKHLKKKKVSIAATKRGRAMSRIQMGSTLKISVIRTIIQSVLERAEYKKFANVFSKVDWSHMNQSASAFKKLIEILEHEHEIA
jgi:ParB family chromosome partitioning protein